MEILQVIGKYDAVKALLVIMAAAGLAGSVAAQDTAYTALRTLRSERGELPMQQVVHVEGEYGQSQPAAWKIFLQDPAARGGVRELVIQQGRIASERTPVRGFGWVSDRSPLNFSRLNLDSNGAFKLANQAAIERRLGFNSVNYELASDPASGAPVWDLTLFDNLGKLVGRMQISAESGKVVRALSVDAGSVEPYTFDAPARPRTPTAPEEDDARYGGVVGRIETIGDRAVDRVRDTTLRIGGTIEEFLTGDRTIDREVD